MDPDKEQNWYFTFGSGHYVGLVSLDRKYVIINGTFESAREKLIQARGNVFASQYDWDSFKHQIPMYLLTEISLNEVKIRSLE